MSAEGQKKLAEKVIGGCKGLEDNDIINFKCAMCGRCCKNIEIMLSLMDIIIMSEGLGITTIDCVQKYCTVHQGHNSHLPVLMLKEVSNGPCEFRVDNKCSIHKYRPAICRLYPLGRMTSMPRDGESKPEIKYLMQDDVTCAGTGNGKQTFKQFMDEAELRKYEEAYSHWNNGYVKLVSEYDLEKLTKEDFVKLVALIFTMADSMISISRKMAREYNLLESSTKQEAYIIILTGVLQSVNIYLNSAVGKLTK